MSPLMVALMPAGVPIGMTDMLLPEPLDDDAHAAMITVAAQRPAIAYGLVNDRFAFMRFLSEGEKSRHPDERSVFALRAQDDMLRNTLQHQFHLVQLRRLIRLDVGRELEHRVVVAGVAMAEQLTHHRDRALVMADHADEEEPVELRAARRAGRRH